MLVHDIGGHWLTFEQYFAGRQGLRFVEPVPFSDMFTFACSLPSTSSASLDPASGTLPETETHTGIGFSL